jgi:hypothetical protein
MQIKVIFYFMTFYNALLIKTQESDRVSCCHVSTQKHRSLGEFQLWTLMNAKKGLTGKRISDIACYNSQ